MEGWNSIFHAARGYKGWKPLALPLPKRPPIAAPASAAALYVLVMHVAAPIGLCPVWRLTVQPPGPRVIARVQRVSQDSRPVVILGIARANPPLIGAADGI